MFAFGKGDRGQLGNDSVTNESHTALPITKAVIMNDDYTAKVEYHALQPISQIASGMIHSAAYEPSTNSVYVWGKHILPFSTDETIATGPAHQTGLMKRMIARDKIASDARIPVLVNGLPPEQSILQIACGSHQTSILLEDGSVWMMGITSDTKRPLHHPICVVEAGIIDLSTLTQFAGHMDRTTIVFDGQVIHVQLWDNPEYQKEAVFTPSWVDELKMNYPSARIREVHRSWLHTAIVADHFD
jgi:alpha-tubulin suppressor-like RCC1 family protein